MRLLGLALLLVFGIAAIALAVREDTRVPNGAATNAPVPNEPSAPSPQLEGKRRAQRDEEVPREDLGSLLDALGSNDEAATAAATARLSERFRSRSLSPTDLLRIAFLPAGAGDVEALRQRALHKLEEGDVSMHAIVPRLLEAAVAADEHVRTVAARLLSYHGGRSGRRQRTRAALRAGRGVETAQRFLRPDDFDAVERVLASEVVPLQAKRALILSIGGLEGRGADLIPLVGRFLKDEAEAIRRRKEEEWRRGVYTTGGEGSAIAVAFGLAELGAPAVPALIDLLAEPGWGIGHSAQAALEWMGDPAVPALVAALDRADALVRKRAATALQGAKTADAAAIAGLRRALDDVDPAVRQAAGGSLAALGDAELVVSQLRSPEASIRWAAVQGLYENEDLRTSLSDEMIEALLALAPRIPRGHWYYYAGLLERLGPRAAPVVPHLLEHLRGEHRPRGLTPRPERVFEAIGTPAVSHLLRALEGNDVRLQDLAAAALTSIPLGDEPGRDALATYLEARPGSRHSVAIALSLAREGEARLLPIFARGLQAEDWDRRSLAAEGIGRLGRAGLPHIEDLAALLADLDAEFERRRPNEWWSACFTYSVRVDRGVRSLGAYDLPRMVSWLSHPCGDVVSVARETMEEGGEPALGLLAQHWGRAEEPVQLRILRALEKLRPAGPKTADGILDRALAHPSARVRVAAAAKAHGSADADRRRHAVEALVALAVDPDAKLADTAARALRDVADGSEVLEAVRAYADHPDPTIRERIRSLITHVEDRE